jgi:poly(A) polymerase
MERARDEFLKILALDNPTLCLRRMDDLGLLAVLLPEVHALKGVSQYSPHEFDVFEHTLRTLDELVAIQANGYTDVANGEFVAELQTHFAQIVSADHDRRTLLRLATLLHDIGKPPTRSVDENGAIHFYGHETHGAAMSGALLRGLRLSNAESELITAIVLHHLRPTLLEHEPRVSNRAVYRFFRDAASAGVDVCVLALADRRGTYAQANAATETRLRAVCMHLLERYFRARDTVIAPPALIDGRTLIHELQLDAGPRVGELLEAIREAQVEGQIKTREEAMAFARVILTKDEGRKTEDE